MFILMMVAWDLLLTLLICVCAYKLGELRFHRAQLIRTRDFLETIKAKMESGKSPTETELADGLLDIISNEPIGTTEGKHFMSRVNGDND